MASSVIGTGGSLATARHIFIGGLIAVLDVDQFVRLVNELRKRGALVIHSVSGVFSKSHIYMVPYNGVVFLTKSRDPLPISVDVEVEKVINIAGLPL